MIDFILVREHVAAENDLTRVSVAQITRYTSDTIAASRIFFTGGGDIRVKQTVSELDELIVNNMIGRIRE